MSALAYALQLLTALPQLIQAGADVMDMITEAQERLQNMQDEGRDPTPGEWDDLNARIDDLRGELHAP
jgi:hypothetical protein